MVAPVLWGEMTMIEHRIRLLGDKVQQASRQTPTWRPLAPARLSIDTYSAYEQGTRVCADMGEGDFRDGNLAWERGQGARGAAGCHECCEVPPRWKGNAFTRQPY